jgi:hypothetical protein
MKLQLLTIAFSLAAFCVSAQQVVLTDRPESDYEPIKINGKRPALNTTISAGPFAYRIYVQDIDKELHYYALQVSPEAKTEPVELESMPMSRSNTVDVVNILVSPNGSFICTEMILQSKDGAQKTVRHKVFDNKLNPVYTSEEKSVPDFKLSESTKGYLTNDGHAYIATAFTPTTCNIYHCSPTVSEIFKFDLSGGRSLRSMGISKSASGDIFVNGVYKTEELASAGVYRMTLDGTTHAKTSESYTDFSYEFLTTQYKWNGDKKDNDEKKRRMREWSYTVTPMMELKDGSSVCVLEQSFRYYIIYSNGTRATDHLFVENVVYKFDPSGNLERLTSVPKIQTCRDEPNGRTNEPYLSYKYFLTKDEKLVLLYNDHEKNYSETGEFLAANPDDLHVYVPLLRSTIASAVVDLRTGAVDRKRILDEKETGTMVALESMEINAADEKVLISCKQKNAVVQF